MNANLSKSSNITCNPDTLMFLEEARPNATNDGCYMPGPDPVTQVHSKRAVFSAVDGHVFIENWDINMIKENCKKIRD